MSKEEWMGCDCCVAVCAEPTVEVESSFLEIVRCGFHALDENFNYVNPPVFYSANIHVADIVESGSGDVGAIVTTTTYTYAGNKLAGGATCPSTTVQTGVPVGNTYTTTGVSNSYEGLVTWVRLLARMDEIFDAEASVGVGDSYSGYVQTGSSYLGVNYPGVPLKLSRSDVKFRLSVPLNHEGTYYAMRYEYECVPDDVSVPAYRFGADEVEWTGVVDVADEDSYRTAYVSVPKVVDGKVYLKKLSYRCYHGGAWQIFD